MYVYIEGIKPDMPRVSIRPSSDINPHGYHSYTGSILKKGVHKTSSWRFSCSKEIDVTIVDMKDELPFDNANSRERKLRAFYHSFSDMLRRISRHSSWQALENKRCRLGDSRNDIGSI